MPDRPDPGADLAFGSFQILRADERLVGPQGPVKLGHKAYRVLLMLAEREGRLLTKDELFDSVWDGIIVSESALTSVIKELRRALGDSSNEPRYIESVYGRGYRLLPPVTAVDGAAAAAAAPRRPPAAAAEGPGAIGDAPLLLLPPFDDSALRGSHPHLGAVLHEEVLLALSRFRDLRLVADIEAPGSGRFGERDYRLSVRLLGDGDAVRAFARLSRLAGGAILWADQIPLAHNHPFDGVEQLTRRIAAAALPRLHDDVLRNMPRQPDDAYDHYFVNRTKMRSLETLEQGRQLAAAWERLIEAHPDFVQAYPPLIRLYDTDYSFTGPGATGETERRRAYELAHRAAAIDPTESHLHTVKGWCHLWLGESALARDHFEQALELNPYHRPRLVEIATGYMFLDDLDRAGELLDRCRSLAAVMTEVPYEEEGLYHLICRDYDGAAESLALARRTHPDDLATAGPSLLTELYALLAAAGLGSADARGRAAAWRDMVAARWAASEPLDHDRLRAWALFHNPFQEPARRDWFVELFDRALTGTGPSARPAPARGKAPVKARA